MCTQVTPNVEEGRNVYFDRKMTQVLIQSTNYLMEVFNCYMLLQSCHVVKEHLRLILLKHGHLNKSCVCTQVTPDVRGEKNTCWRENRKALHAIRTLFNESESLKLLKNRHMFIVSLYCLSTSPTSSVVAVLLQELIEDHILTAFLELSWISSPKLSSLPFHHSMERQTYRPFSHYGDLAGWQNSPTRTPNWKRG